MTILERLLTFFGVYRDPSTVKLLETEELECIVENPQYVQRWLVPLAKEEIEVRKADFERRSDKYRLYADGTIVHEDDFGLYNNSLPYYDDYGEYRVPHDTVHMLKLHERGLIPAEIVQYVLDETDDPKC